MEINSTFYTHLSDFAPVAKEMMMITKIIIIIIIILSISQQQSTTLAGCMSVVTVKVETTTADKRHCSRESAVLLRLMDAATCKSRVLDSISSTDRRLWRLSDFYPVACFSDNEENKKFLNTV